MLTVHKLRSPFDLSHFICAKKSMLIHLNDKCNLCPQKIAISILNSEEWKGATGEFMYAVMINIMI
jgi:hypothetical protein